MSADRLLNGRPAACGDAHEYMPMNPLNLDDFPNSAYAFELRRGLTQLHFESVLEQEYQEAHLRRMRLRVRIWYSVNLVLAVLFSVDQVSRTGVWNALSLMHVSALVPCTAALAALAWSPQYQRWYLPAAQVLVTLFGTLVAVFVVLTIIRGREEQLASLTVILVSMFFFAGLLFRQAIFIAVCMLIAFAIAAIVAHLAFIMLVKSMVIMTLTCVIAAIVCWDVEQSHRRNFLENALIGELVSRDGLSGLMNRRAFDEHLLRVWQHALRDHRSIAVFMIDIDNFKRYNDTLGHQAGDVALRCVADVAQGFARRPLDIAARYGGEEFAMVMYDLATPYIRDIAERLREAVQNLALNRPAGESGNVPGATVTVSVGVGLAAPTIGRTPQGAVQLADEALYEAKRAGRNRVVVKGTEVYKLLVTGAFEPRDRVGWRG